MHRSEQPAKLNFVKKFEKMPCGAGPLAALFDEGPNRSPHLGSVDFDCFQLTGADLVTDGSFGNDRDAIFDLHGALQGFDVVELHRVPNLHTRFPEATVDLLARGEVGIERDEFFPVEFWESDFELLCEPVRRRADEYQAIPPERKNVESATPHGIGDEANFRLSLGHRGVDPSRSEIINEDFDVGELFPVLLQIRRQFVEADAVNRRNAERTHNHLPHAEESALERVGRLENLPRGVEKHPALGGEGKVAAAAFDERDVESLLDRPHLLADGALRNADDFRGPRKACRLRERGKNPEHLNLHDIARRKESGPTLGPQINSSRSQRNKETCMSTIEIRLEGILSRIAAAADRAGRNKEDVTLVAVSKFHLPDVVREAFDAGQTLFGESRVQEALPKIDALPAACHWHFIGHLQKNKIRKALGAFELFHGVDSLEIARDFNRIGAEEGLRPRVLLEVNVAGESTKFGFSPDRLRAEIEECLALDRLEIEGLMCMAPIVETPDQARPFFAACRELRDELAERTGCPLTQLSMGMTADFEAAIQEGATYVRVGSALFGERR